MGLALTMGTWAYLLEMGDPISKRIQGSGQMPLAGNGPSIRYLQSDSDSMPFRPGILCIENPDQPDLDMGRGSYNMPRIRRAFEHAHQVLLVALAPSLYDDAIPSVLAHIIRSDDPVLSSRSQAMKRNKETMSSSIGTNSGGSKSSAIEGGSSDDSNASKDEKVGRENRGDFSVEQEVVWIDLEANPKTNSPQRKSNLHKGQHKNAQRDDSVSQSSVDEVAGVTPSHPPRKGNDILKVSRQSQDGGRRALQSQKRKRNKSLAGEDRTGGNAEPVAKFSRNCPEEDTQAPASMSIKKRTKKNRRNVKNKETNILKK